MRKIILKIFLILIILIQTKEVNAAFTISPQHLILMVNNGERVGWVELENTGKFPIAIELVAQERLLDLDGNLNSAALKNSEDFTIYPAQILLYPGNKAKSQVVLKGKEKITKDKAYLLYAKEVPFNFPTEEGEEKKVKVGLLLKINFQTIIALETGKPSSISFVSSKTLDSGRVEVIVENKSDGKFHVNRLYIMDDYTKISEFISGNTNSIMPGQKRRFVFKHDKAITEKEFDYGME